MHNALFSGSGVALATPFTDTGIDFGALRRLIDMHVTQGTDAIIVLGTTGEPSTMTEAERESVLCAASEYLEGRLPLIAGCGANSTAEATRMASRAKKLGADGILCVTPYYNRPSQKGLIEHFTRVADATDLPVIAYNVPHRTGIDMEPETALALCRHPNIRALKEARADVAKTAETMRLCGEWLTLYSGSDELTLPLLSLGAAGVISVAANVLPADMHKLVESWLRGERDEAKSIQLRLLPFMRALFVDPSPAPVKAMLEEMGLCTARVRLPLTEARPETRKLCLRLMRSLDAEQA